MRKKQLSMILFLILQLYIYSMLMCFPTLINIKAFSFACILLCFIVGIYLFCKTKDYYIMIISLGISLIGDIFFIFFDNFHIVSLICLNIVQILYFLRIFIDSYYKKLNILSRIIFIPTIIFFGYFLLKEKFDIIAMLWIIFITNLFLNIIFTIKEIGINNLFPIGLLLLLVYGINMMFVYLPNYISVNIRFIDIIIGLPLDIKLMFYLPSIVVLTCSIFTVNKRSFSEIDFKNQK